MMKKYLSRPIVSLIIMLFLFSFQALAQENDSGRLIKFETSLGDMLVMLYDETPGPVSYTHLTLPTTPYV